MRLRSYLVLLVLITLAPFPVFFGFMVYQHGATYRTGVERELLQATHAVGAALDDYFDTTIRTLQDLATSEHLDAGRLRDFHAQARRVHTAHGEWIGVSLFDLAGQRLLYTSEPFGAPLPPRPGVMAARFRAVVEARQPGVSDVFTLPARKRLGFSVGVPVVRDDQVRYVLSTGIDGAALTRILARQRIPEDRTLFLMDRQLAVAARSRASEHTEETMSASLASRARADASGVFRESGKDGIPAYVAFSRSPRFGWTSSLAASAAAVDATATGPLWTVLGVGVGVVLVGALLAIWVGRRVDHSVQRIVAEADRLGRGESPRLVPSVIREVRELSASLVAAGRERARVDEEFRRHAGQQTALAEFGRRALSGIALDRLIADAVKLVADTLGVEFVALFEQLPDAAGARLRAGVGWPAGMVGTFAVPSESDTPLGHTIRSHEPVFIADLRQQFGVGVAPVIRDLGIVSGVTVVVGGAEAPWGVLGAYTTRSRNFARDEGSFLQAVANALGALIERARAEQERARYAQRLEILREIDRVLIANEEPVAIAEAVLFRLRDLLGVPRAIVNLFDLAAGEVEWLAAVGRRRMRLGPAIRYPLRFAGDLEALRRGEPQVIEVDSLPPGPDADALRASGVQVYIVVPMLAGGELIGSVSIGREHGPFPAELVSIAQEVATQLAIAITQARLHEQVRGQALELERRVEERTGELEEANRELEAFTYTVSHDLKSPLRGLVGFCQALQEDYGDGLDATGRRYLATIRDSASRMGQLIDDLLRYARVERRAIERRPVRLKPMLDQLLQDFTEELETRHLTVTDDLAVGEVMAEREGLREALANLLSNAVKFSPARDGSISLRSYRDGDRVVMAVADQGIGFDMKYHDRIFGIFERLHRQEEYPGTGVGLAIVRKVAERHGGRAWAESEIGRGSVFYFTVPSP
jgi:signal transduction histidine kinase